MKPQNKGSHTNSVRKLHSHSLKDFEKNKIRRLSKTGLSMNKIAVLLGVSSSTVHYYVNPAKKEAIRRYYLKNRDIICKRMRVYGKWYNKTHPDIVKKHQQKHDAKRKLQRQKEKGLAHV